MQTPTPTAAAHDPIGIIGPEWALERSSRGAALWRHAGAMTASAGEAVEVFALDLMGRGHRLSHRDQWNVPASGARFRVRRVLTGGRAFAFSDIDRARLEGLVLDWVREHKPRLVHVLELEPFGPGLLLALQAADVPVILTMQRLDGLRAALAPQGGRVAAPDTESGSTEQSSGPQASTASESEKPASAVDPVYAEALRSVRRIVVRSAADAATAQASGAPREKIRVMAGGRDGEVAVLRAYASLYRLLAAPA